MRPSFPALLAVTVLLTTPLPGTARDWQLLPDRSQLSFVATQQGARFRGRFEAFDAVIRLDPAAPGEGRIEATVRTASVNTQNAERDEYLRGADWFHSEQWPEARFVSTAIRPAADGGLVAEGRLSLRDVSRTVPFYFSFDAEGEDGRARLSGWLEIRRLRFGVGRGLWENTEWVGDEVRVEVELVLEPAGATQSRTAARSRK